MAITGIAAGAGGVVMGYAARLIVGRYRAEAKEKRASDVLQDAKRESKALKKEGEIQAKTDVLKAKENFEKSTKQRRDELAVLEERIDQREQNLERKVSMIDKKERSIDEKIAEVEAKTAAIQEEKEDLAKLVADVQEQLQRVAGMTRDEAKSTLLQSMEKEVHGDVGGLIRRLQEEAKETAEREAKKIIALAIQRYSASHASDITTSTVALPNDEMKGRIIGREGRNIRSLEAATGVNVLIDDTPEAVVISGFDPIRREIAKQSLEILIADGRIHPTRIEEVVEKATEGMSETIRQAGEEAAYEAGVQGLEPELLRMLGRLKFRTSYSQNVLKHSIEVSVLMSSMAGEIGLDAAVARRIGLLHDIGKSVDHEVEGGHAVIGADLLKRHGEEQVVVNAVAAHHEEVEAESLYAVLASAADTISCSRPGARAETTGIYIKRLEKLEALANGFDGVHKSYAIQAGREVRVIIDPKKIDDNQAIIMARDISKSIESELQYPGEIRVVVVRETRSVEYAR